MAYKQRCQLSFSLERAFDIIGLYDSQMKSTEFYGTSQERAEGTKIAVLTTLSEIHCAYLCYSDSSCIGFNLLDAVQGDECELMSHITLRKVDAISSFFLMQVTCKVNEFEKNYE